MCENFTGITCNSNGFVTEIELSNQNVTGVVPLDLKCQLQSLEKLSLGFNHFKGQIMAELQDCVKLRYLDLGNNLFREDFQFPNDVLQLTNLKCLYLSYCNIQGAIPAGIGNLKQLTILQLSDNNMTGEIPTEIGKLVNLRNLELFNNSFTGKLPIGLRKITKLELFDASRNYLEGDLSELRFLNKLVSLQLYENKLSSQVPSEFSKFNRLVNLTLYRNSFTGPLPQNLGTWAKLGFIDVSENFFNGPIPPNMCKQGTLRELLLLQNNLTGKIPVTYAKCSTLYRFRVNKNFLSGTVPTGIWGLPNLRIIDISLNSIEGAITSDIKNAKSLQQIFASNNCLSGALPTEISEATSLVSIKLNDNQISGNIPTSIGDLKRLSVLHFQNNKLSGPIPETVGFCEYLNDINFANNLLSGHIPSSLGSLKTLYFLNLSYNQLSGEIPRSFASLPLSILDLSHNRLYDSQLSKDIMALIIICLALGLLLLVAALVFCFKLKKSGKDRDCTLKDKSWNVNSFHMLTFTVDQILNSIKQENLIGRGRSGKVYKALVCNGTELRAVKHILNTNCARKSKEFDSEVRTLSSIRHVNVVKLYCSITSEDSCLLVYEYLRNGSLWDRLHTSQPMQQLDWDTRYEIAVGIAKGLDYLHYGCDMIHRDIKSGNILLDENMKPKIADFGLAKTVQANGGEDSSHLIVGTHGYIAPG